MVKEEKNEINKTKLTNSMNGIKYYKNKKYF